MDNLETARTLHDANKELIVRRARLFICHVTIGALTVALFGILWAVIFGLIYVVVEAFVAMGWASFQMTRRGLKWQKEWDQA